MKLEDQRQRFAENWEKNKSLLGTKSWGQDPNFLFFVEIPLAVNLRTSMEKISSNLQGLANEKNKKGLWVAPQRMHITLALPGRMGVHFQGNEVGFMEKKLTSLVEEFAPFEVTLGDLNCFPDVIYREVYDESRNLMRLHQRICEEIPFAQSPEYQFEHFLPHVTMFYGPENPQIFEHPDFKRTLKSSSMKVDKIYFGKARNDKDKYEKHILSEYSFVS